MSEVVNIKILKDTWVNVNTLSGIPVGAEFRIQNDGVTWVRVQESGGQPLDEKEGKLLTNLDKSSSSALIPTGSGEIWARSSVIGRDATLAVQETK
tara:strand:- start:786 stop:1073 length:288 start_codon:yes stop_codon:yes gene_type:complete